MFFRYIANLGFYKPSSTNEAFECSSGEMIFCNIFFTKVCSVQKFSLSLHLSFPNTERPRVGDLWSGIALWDRMTDGQQWIIG